MPRDVAATLDQMGGYWCALLSVLPQLQTVARVTRRSTSAGLFRADTGERLPGSDGMHDYIAVKDGTDIERFLKTLHERCWLAGFGWMMVGAGGQLLERSIIDRMVGAPERLVFEGGPVLEPPLSQDKESRRPIVVEGDALDTLAACPPLTVVEISRLRELKAKWQHRLAGETAKVRAAFITGQSKRLAEKKGITLEQARQVVARQCAGVLLPDVVLPFDDAEFAGCTVADVIADPDRFEGATLADPLEGPEYGTCKARVMRRVDGSLWIHSFAHGRTVYELKRDAVVVRAALERADKEAVANLFIELVITADLNAAEIELLRNLVVEKSGINRSTINNMLKTALKQKRENEAKNKQERRLAERRDPRPQIEVPLADAPWKPQMDIINEVFSRSTAREPPVRNIDGTLTWARKLALPGLHAFDPTQANAENPGANKLPPPEQWLLQCMGEIEASEMIERHIDYVNAHQRSVHLPTQFVRHYLTRHDEVLPMVVAIATLPIVLADGSLLASDGLDHEHGIIFKISDELRAVLPRREDCTDAAVNNAMEFLCNEWLCDVATDFVGKCVLIAAELSLITTLIMLIMAVLGIRPAAAAWSPNEEERRKALLSYLVAGVSYILWDNITRGSQISCPHIEKSCTAAYYSDRLLGASQIATAAAAAIHFFTGNNTGPKGDLASRSLRVRLVTDRPDPENRDFKHPDPIGWTETHRADILRSLYIILLGNPTLSQTNVKMKTRFKTWWRLVGSAVEHAARLVKEHNAVERETMDRETREKMDANAALDVDFKNLFLSQEEDDEDTSSLGETLVVIEQRWSKPVPTTIESGTTAAAVADLINMRDATTDQPVEVLQQMKRDSAVLRDFLYGSQPTGFVATAHSVGQLLKAHVDEPVRYGGRILVLRSRKRRDDVAIYYVQVVSDTNENATETSEHVSSKQQRSPERPRIVPKAAMTAAPVAPIAAWEMDELKQRGFTPDDVFGMYPERARAILADPDRNKLTEKYGKGGDAPPETICRVCKKPGAKYFSDPDPTAGMREEGGGRGSWALHLGCCPRFFESSLPVED